MSRIKKLDIDTINKIAAGEIISKPTNMAKELLENALDAGATQIQIIVKDGGMKLFSIQDNGSGINESDLELVCERFTTSKLKSIDDLGTIGTFGFRGEALASISTVSQLTITTKQQSSPCAFKCSYSNTKLVSKTPCAGNTGTLIAVQDLFYNMPTRRKSIKPNESYQSLLSMVQKYSIHKQGVSISCRKHDKPADVNTQSMSSRLDNLRHVFGLLPNHLVEIYINENDLKVTGYFSNTEYQSKKSQFVFFINNRLVELPDLKKSLEQVYGFFLMKGTHPFVYLALDLDPKTIDVNVHPSKQQVYFLHSQEIIKQICQEIQKQLNSTQDQRSFAPEKHIQPRMEVSHDKQPKKILSGSSNKIRTDYKVQKLDSFFSQKSSPSKTHTIKSLHNPLQPEAEYDHSLKRTSSIGAEDEWIQVELTSVQELLQELLDHQKPHLTDIFREHVFVGPINDNLALVQHQTKLYSLDLEVISEQFFYQIILRGFSNFGRLHLQHPLRLLDYADTFRLKPLIEKRLMLEEYFSISIDENCCLKTLPVLMKTYQPDQDIQEFVLGLSRCDYTNEKQCFKDISKCIASFYRLSSQKSFGPFLDYTRQEILCQQDMEDSIVLLTTTQQLYKIFERC
ncbi:hypothetical protein EDD86DRAFT_193518 [Gorgonomyces haynaldii]|nr:hypothetical protein EDD86DRAFT_193518 [Gorgonomyces haynaldii]